MDNIISPDTSSQIPQKSFSKKKIIFVSLAIVIVAGLAIFFFFKYNKPGINQKPLTKQQKIDILNGLNKNPPNDGSVPMTMSEKLNILEDITSKKPADNAKRVELTKEEQQKIFDSIK